MRALDRRQSAPFPHAAAKVLFHPELRKVINDFASVVRCVKCGPMDTIALCGTPGEAPVRRRSVQRMSEQNIIAFQPEKTNFVLPAKLRGARRLKTKDRAGFDVR